VNGVEPFLYECLASTFLQAYPSSKLTFSFCLSTRRDPALRIVQRVLADFAAFDARIFIEEEDPNLAGKDGQEHNLGPNPKIRNMSRAYREAKGDIIWIIDCNVWIDKTVAGLMVDHLCGFSLASHGRKYKFVHQLPLVVDVSALPTLPIAAPLTGTASLPKLSESSRLLTEAASTYGSLLEELFLSTSHAKFYTAISTVAIAPCTVGKSNMFRRSHLDALTPPSLTTPARAPGIDFFSDNICEDHLIGDLLWKSPVPAAVLSAAIFEGHTPTADSPTPAPSRPALPNAQNWGNHALLFAPPCIQPLTLSLQSYAARRTRWLRVRKFTVPLATLVEPGTESLLATGYGAFGLTTLGRCQAVLGIPPTWGAFALLWALGLLAWAACDYWVWRMLQGWAPGREGETKRAGGGGRPRRRLWAAGGTRRPAGG
jgi:ceramide glucosyltransferase